MSDNLYKQKSYLREISTDFQERKRILSKLVSNVGVMQNEVEHQARQLDDVQVGSSSFIIHHHHSSSFIIIIIITAGEGG